MSIVVEPHMIRRTLPGDSQRVPGRGHARSVVEERDWDFSWFARSGSVSAIARTREGAVSMVERILAHRG